MKYVDPLGLETKGLGGGIYVDVFGHHLEGSIMVSEDDDGNRVFETSGGYGRNSDKTQLGLGAQATYQTTEADSVDQLAGVSGKIGGDVLSLSDGKGRSISLNVEKLAASNYTGINRNLKFEVGGKPSGKRSMRIGPRGGTGVLEHTGIVKVPKIQREYEADLW